MCVCWLLLGRIISLVKNAQYASNQSKRGQPEIYQLKLSRVCGAELDAKPWRCEDVPWRLEGMSNKQEGVGLSPTVGKDFT